MLFAIIVVFTAFQRFVLRERTTIPRRKQFVLTGVAGAGGARGAGGAPDAGAVAGTTDSSTEPPTDGGGRR